MAQRVIRQTSAGGIVVRRVRGRLETCLILRTRHAQRAWCLPKGHLEAGEDARDAAQREVREETGLTCEILEPVGEIAYQFDAPGQAARVHKTVQFFLMRCRSGEPSPQDPEAVEARWMPLEEALAQAAYDNERRLLEALPSQLGRPELAGRIPDVADS